MAIQPIGASGTIAEVEDATDALRTVTRPDDYGGAGIYCLALQSGVMAAGLGAAANIFTFRNAFTQRYFIVKRVVMSVCGNTTAWTAGVCQFNMFVARNFTAASSGGTAATTSHNNMKRRTNMAPSDLSRAEIATTGTVTAGTWTLDAQPMASLVAGVSATASLVIIPPGTLMFEARASEFPLVLASHEGFTIQATVPATGTWNVAVQVYWTELFAADIKSF